MHKTLNKTDDAVRFPKLTWIFRFAPFFARSDIIWCCLFSAARWRQARPASTHHWGQSEVKRDQYDQKESNRDHDYTDYTDWLFWLGNNHKNNAWNDRFWRKRSESNQSAYLSSSGSRGLVPTCLGKHFWSSRSPSLSGLADRLRGALCSHRGPAAPGWPLSPSAPSPRVSGLGRQPDAKDSADHQTRPSGVFTTVGIKKNLRNLKFKNQLLINGTGEASLLKRLFQVL